MSKQTKLWGVSLLILAFSVNANAQTCKVPPTCESMGFNQTVTSCSGKTILKCPFDETKVYCPSAIENNPIYKVGDIYLDDKGIGIGKVVSITDGGRHGTVVAKGGFTESSILAQDFCKNNTLGGLSWNITTGKKTCEVFDTTEHSCILISMEGKGYCNLSHGWYKHGSDCNTILGFACEASF